MNENVRDILEQLVENEEIDVMWFSVPGGIFSGSIEDMDKDRLTLNDACCHTGNAKLLITAAEIIIDQIAAFGAGSPKLGSYDGGSIT